MKKGRTLFVSLCSVLWFAAAMLSKDLYAENQDPFLSTFQIDFCFGYSSFSMKDFNSHLDSSKYSLVGLSKNATAALRASDIKLSYFKNAPTIEGSIRIFPLRRKSFGIGLSYMQAKMDGSLQVPDTSLGLYFDSYSTTFHGMAALFIYRYAIDRFRISPIVGVGASYATFESLSPLFPNDPFLNKHYYGNGLLFNFQLNFQYYVLKWAHVGLNGKYRIANISKMSVKKSSQRFYLKSTNPIEFDYSGFTGDAAIGIDF